MLIREKSTYFERGDTTLFRGVCDAMLYVVGSTLAPLDMVMKGADRIERKVENAFVSIADLHHARIDSTGGSL